MRLIYKLSAIAD